MLQLSADNISNVKQGECEPVQKQDLHFEFNILFLMHAHRLPKASHLGHALMSNHEYTPFSSILFP